MQGGSPKGTRPARRLFLVHADRPRQDQCAGSRQTGRRVDRVDRGGRLAEHGHHGAIRGLREGWVVPGRRHGLRNACPRDLSIDAGLLRGREARLRGVGGAADLAQATLRIDAGDAVRSLLHAREPRAGGIAGSARALVILYGDTLIGGSRAGSRTLQRGGSRRQREVDGESAGELRLTLRRRAVTGDRVALVSRGLRDGHGALDRAWFARVRAGGTGSVL